MISEFTFLTIILLITQDICYIHFDVILLNPLGILTK